MKSVFLVRPGKVVIYLRVSLVCESYSRKSLGRPEVGHLYLKLGNSARISRDWRGFTYLAISGRQG